MQGCSQRPWFKVQRALGASGAISAIASSSWRPAAHAPAASSMTSSRGPSIVLPLQAFCRCRCGGDRCRKAVSGHCKKKRRSLHRRRPRGAATQLHCRQHANALHSFPAQPWRAWQPQFQVQQIRFRPSYWTLLVLIVCLQTVRKGPPPRHQTGTRTIHMATAARSNVTIGARTCVAGAAARQPCARACPSTVLSGTHCHRVPAIGPHVPPQHKACVMCSDAPQRALTVESSATALTSAQAAPWGSVSQGNEQTLETLHPSPPRGTPWDT